MKKIISVVMLLVCIFYMIVPVSVAYAEENIEYECIQLPIISDKSKEVVTDITLYKDDDVLYAPLHTVCPLINAEWYMKDGGFYISRDNCMYFRYYHDGNMKLIIDLDIGDDKWNKSDNILLEGNIFSCKKIGVEWCVDFIKFCDMFGVTFHQVSPSTIQSAKDNIKKNIEDSAFEKLNNIDIENDLDFNNNPYYIYLYTGTPLISLYAQVMRDKNLYIWDYSCYENLNLSEEDNAWIEEILKSIQYSDITQYLTIQSQNCLSNVVNDNWGITKLITAPSYDSSEHYKKALVNISGINYGESLKSEDIESINRNNKAQELERLLNSNTILSSSDSTITILNKYLNDQIKIPELEAFTKVSDVINCIGTPFQTYFEVEDFHNKLNSINEDKIQLLTKAIIENDSINNMAKKQKTGNNVLSYLNKTATTNIFLNSIDNYTGLMDSSKEICSLYKNSQKQFQDELDKSIESGAYAIGDTVISKTLEKSENPYLVLIGAVIGVYDGFTAWAKENFGEQLQNSEILVQAYFIERTMKESLDIKNPENLYNRLTLMLQSSLCCFEYDEKYFQTNRNKISKMLYMLDNDKSININYYHDPRNNNIDENVKDAIKNYSDNKIEPNTNYTWHLDPTIEAEDIIVIDNKDKLLEEGYTSPYDECALIKQDGKYGIIKYDGTNMAEPIYGFGGYDIQGAIGVYNEYDQTKGAECVDVFPDKEALRIQTNQIRGWGYVGSEYLWINNKVAQTMDNYSIFSGEYYDDDYNVVVQSAQLDSDKRFINISNQYGIANKNGLLVPIEYDKGYMHSYNNIIALCKGEKWTYFNENGKSIIENCEGFKSNSHVIDWWEGGGYNYNEDYILPYIPTENYIPVKINGKCGYYDIQGKEVVPCGTFEEVRPVHNGLAWVKKDGKWGVIKLDHTETEKPIDLTVNIDSTYIGELTKDNCTYYYTINTNEDSSLFTVHVTNSNGIEGGYDLPITNVENGVYFYNDGSSYDRNQTTGARMHVINGLTGTITVNSDGSLLWKTEDGLPHELILTIMPNIEKVPLFTGTVNTEKDPLNVRKSPSDNAEIIGQVKKGSNVTIYSETDGWYEIEYNGGVGYVSKKYIISKGNSSDSKESSISDNQILKAVNRYLEENQSHLGVWLSDSNPYCPAGHMYSNDTKWSCPINTDWDIYSSNEIAGAYPHFAYVDKSSLKCTVTANYETVVEFDLNNYIN